MTTPAASIKFTEIPTLEEIDSAAQERIARRQQTGRDLIEVAAKLKEAQLNVELLTKQYADAHRAATKDAWSVEELQSQGLPAPVLRKRPQRRRRSGTDKKQPDSSNASGAE